MLCSATCHHALLLWCCMALLSLQGAATCDWSASWRWVPAGDGRAERCHSFSFLYHSFSFSHELQVESRVVVCKTSRVVLHTSLCCVVFNTKLWMHLSWCLRFSFTASVGSRKYGDNFRKLTAVRHDRLTPNIAIINNKTTLEWWRVHFNLGIDSPSPRFRLIHQKSPVPQRLAPLTFYIGTDTRS